MKRLLSIILAHKKTSLAVTVLVAIISVLVLRGMFSGSQSDAYVLTRVERGSITETVSGSGNIRQTSTLELKPQKAGVVEYVAVEEGDVVHAGDTLVVINNDDAALNVQDAELNLLSAQNALDDLLASRTGIELVRAENAFNEAEREYLDLQNGADEEEIASAERAVDAANRNLVETTTDAEQDLSQAYEDGYRATAEAMNDLTEILGDLWDVLGTDSSTYEYVGYYDILVGASYADQVEENITAADYSYNETWANYKNSSYESDAEIKSALISVAAETAEHLGDALTSAQHLCNALESEGYANSAIRDHIDGICPQIDADVLTINTHISALQAAAQEIDDVNLRAPNSIADAEDTLADTQATLRNLLNGEDADTVAAAAEQMEEARIELADLQGTEDASDIIEKKLAVKKYEIALSRARKTLSDYSVHAPADGYIIELNADVGAIATTSEAVAILAAEGWVAEVTINENDIAQIAVGQAANIAVDASEDQSLLGTVVSMSQMPVSNSGAVDYQVNVLLQEDNSSFLRSGMTADVEIVTQEQGDVLLIPAEAVVYDGNAAYVLNVQEDVEIGSTVNLAQEPKRVAITIGVENDAFVEVTSGVSEGMIIVQKMVSAQTSKGFSLPSPPEGV